MRLFLIGAVWYFGFVVNLLADKEGCPENLGQLAEQFLREYDADPYHLDQASLPALLEGALRQSDELAFWTLSTSFKDALLFSTNHELILKFVEAIAAQEKLFLEWLTEQEGDLKESARFFFEHNIAFYAIPNLPEALAIFNGIDHSNPDFYIQMSAAYRMFQTAFSFGEEDNGSLFQDLHDKGEMESWRARFFIHQMRQLYQQRGPSIGKPIADLDEEIKSGRERLIEERAEWVALFENQKAASPESHNKLKKLLFSPKEIDPDQLESAFERLNAFEFAALQGSHFNIMNRIALRGDPEIVQMWKELGPLQRLAPYLPALRYFP